MNSAISVYLVDDNSDHACMIQKTLTQELTYNFRFQNYLNGKEALGALGKAAQEPDLILLDLHMPGKNGLEILRDIRRMTPHVPVIMITSSMCIENAVKAIKEGAMDYITKPFHDPKAMGATVQKALKHLPVRRSVTDPNIFSLLLNSRSEEIQKLNNIAVKVAQTPSTVLLTGESGTGKDLWARYIHDLSPRTFEKFTALNCSALPEHLLESELFGYVKGAFTGAASNKPGLLQETDGGTFFFDEIADLSLPMQTKLLRFLQNREIRQTGGLRTYLVDVRVIAATNRDLEKEVKEGRFRHDLYYRLNVVRIHLPALRERKADLPSLIEYFLHELNRENSKNITRIAPEALDFLKERPWPGNIRELRNVVERAVVFSQNDTLDLESLMFLHDDSHAKSTPSPQSQSQPFHRAKELVMHNFTAAYLKRLLEQHQGNVTRAAKEARLGRQSFHRLLKRYGVSAKSFKTQ